MNPVSETSVGKETTPSSAKKFRKTLKKLLQSKPLSAVESVEEPSTSKASENVGERKISQDNEYMLNPVGSYSFFNESNLQEYYDDFKSSSPDCLLIANIGDLSQLTLKFNNKPVIRNNYTQYSFLKVPTLALTIIPTDLLLGIRNNSLIEQFLRVLAALEAKHRVSPLLPTAEHWWNKNSASMFSGFIQHVGTAIKSLAMDEDFKTSMKRFRHNKDVLVNFKNKYLSATKIINNKTVPAVFGVRIYNSIQFNSEINLPMAQITHDDSLEDSSGSDLLPPTYMHSLLLLSVQGFKITRSGISLDTEVNYLLYCPFQRSKRTKQSPFSLKKHVVQKRVNNSLSTSLNLSSSFSDVEEWPTKKICKPDTLELEW